MDPRQRANGLRILWAVSDFAAANHYTRKEARRAGRLAIMCAMTESNLWNYANRHIPESLALPHEQVGQDHASVGLFQQQVPGWGTVSQCMNAHHATTHFLRVLRDKGQLPPYDGPPLWERVQAVQVSATADGSNYKRNAWRSRRFLIFRWSTSAARPYGKRPAP